jgi:serine/threonine protein kinase
MATHDEDRDPLEVLAAEFAERYRRGQSPSISEYVGRYPEWAAEIEEIFPTIAVMERLKTHQEQTRGPQVSLGTIPLERLGDFRILGEIGRGGMGIVCEAFQESLGRHVAVKVLPRQSLLDARQLHRFQREAQTAARLHHTNIVPVFGVGEHEGFHYIVMQLIHGVGLDALLARLQQPQPDGSMTAGPEAGEVVQRAARREGKISGLARAMIEGRLGQPRDSAGATDDLPDEADRSRAATEAVTEAFRPDPPKAGTTPESDVADRPSLTSRSDLSYLGLPYWRSVAMIGKQVAEALQYAHSHHTLHRDIKPANLLLDAQGVVWITDFGLAKAMEQDDLTQAGIVAGTLCYMAPEQFSGEADARSDIYSLGLTLYELLTLQPAFVEPSRSRLIGKISHEEPVRPRRLNPKIPRDLETIVLKAISHDPADRYQTAGDLARDLDCFLDDRPIRARRFSPIERLWRWARRNRTVAALTATTLLLLVVVAAVAIAGYFHTVQANIEEARLRKKAEDTSALAIEALDNIFQRFAPDRSVPTSSLLMRSSASKQLSVPVQPVLSKEAASLLEQMLAFYDRLAAQGANDLQLRQKVAEANRRVGDIRQRLGQYKESQAAYRHAIDLYKKLADTTTHDSTLRIEIARIYNELGNVLCALRDRKAGYASYAEALAILTTASNKGAGLPEYQYELARTYYYLGKRFGRPQGPPPLAPGGRRGAIAGPPRTPSEPKEAKDSTADSPDGSPQRVLRPPATDGFFQLPPEEAETNLQKAIAILEQLVIEHPATPDYRHVLARCYREVVPRPGQSIEPAKEAANKAIAILQKLVHEYPNVPDYRYDLSECYAWLGSGMPSAMQTAGPTEYTQSRKMIETALAISEELVAEHPNIPDYAIANVNTRVRLADLLWEIDPTQAEACLRTALGLQSSLARRFAQNFSCRFGVVIVREALVSLLLQHNRPAEARSILQGSIALLHELQKEESTAEFVGFVLYLHYTNLSEVCHSLDDEKAAADAVLHAEKLTPPQP